MAIGILADTRKGIVIQTIYTNCDLIALVWRIRELARRIREIDKADDPVQLKGIRRLMDLEAQGEIPLKWRDEIARIRQLFEMALANDLLDDEVIEELERAVEKEGELLRKGNGMLEELLAERRRKARKRRKGGDLDERVD